MQALRRGTHLGAEVLTLVVPALREIPLTEAETSISLTVSTFNSSG
jgi:hypothetical protein